MATTRPGPEPSASSSDDLEQARRLSRSLVAPVGAKGTTPSAAPASSSYTSLRPAAPQPDAQQGVLFGSGRWERLLDRVAAMTSARAAFLMDPRGLVVASRGPLPADELEGTGSRLLIMFEQADRMGTEPARSVAVELGVETLTGLRPSAVAGAEVLTLGVLGPGLSPFLRTSVQELVRNELGG